MRSAKAKKAIDAIKPNRRKRKEKIKREGESRKKTDTKSKRRNLVSEQNRAISVWAADGNLSDLPRRLRTRCRIDMYCHNRLQIDALS